jgi:hypothetical protein
LNKKKFYAIIGVLVVLFSSFVLVYASVWTPDDMAAYMQNIGRHKIYQTNWILYNEIGPQLDDIQTELDKTTQMLASYSDSFVTSTLGTHDIIYIHSDKPAIYHITIQLWQAGTEDNIHLGCKPVSGVLSWREQFKDDDYTTVTITGFGTALAYTNNDDNINVIGAYYNIIVQGEGSTEITIYEY